MGDYTVGYVVGYTVGGGLALVLKYLGNSYEVVMLALLAGALVTLLLDQGGN